MQEVVRIVVGDEGYALTDVFILAPSRKSMRQGTKNCIYCCSNDMRKSFRNRKINPGICLFGERVKERG